MLKEIEKLGNSIKRKVTLPNPVIDKLRSVYKEINSSDPTQEKMISILIDLEHERILGVESNYLHQIILGAEGKLNPYKDYRIVNSAGTELVANVALIKSKEASKRKYVFSDQNLKDRD